MEKLVDSARTFEFTQEQSEGDRMAVFTDDYVSPNYNKPAVVRMRKESKLKILYSGGPLFCGPIFAYLKIIHPRTFLARFSRLEILKM